MTMFEITVKIVPYRTADSACYGWVEERGYNKTCKHGEICDILRRINLLQESLRQQNPGQWTAAITDCDLYEGKVEDAQ